jgi:transcriptional regulator with XRE-family HTH domain
LLAPDSAYESGLIEGEWMGIDAPVAHYDWLMDDSALTFGQLIARARSVKGWTQGDLETHSGVSRPTISRWERDAMNGTPEPDTVRALCKALGIDPRQAAVALGYLTLDEIEPVQPLPPKLQQILDILKDPRLSKEEVDQWVAYLQYLQAKKDAGTTSPAS